VAQNRSQENGVFAIFQIGRRLFADADDAREVIQPNARGFAHGSDGMGEV